jgi:hypothetical protein
VTCSWQAWTHTSETTRSRPAAMKLTAGGRRVGIGRPVTPFHSCSCPAVRSCVSGPASVAPTSPNGNRSTGLTRRPARLTAQVGLRKPAGTPSPFRRDWTAVCTHTSRPSGLTAIMVAGAMTWAGAFAVGMKTTRPSAR